MQHVVVAIGGSILITDGDDLSYIQELAALLKTLSQEYKLYIVVGGGRLAREYISIAKDLGGLDTYLDEIGILATRMNARVFLTALGLDAYPRPPCSLEEALKRGQHADLEAVVEFLVAQHFSHLLLNQSHDEPLTIVGDLETIIVDLAPTAAPFAAIHVLGVEIAGDP